MADKLHILNVSFLVENMRKGFGGTAGNIAYTLALLKTPVSLLGSIGQDFTPYETFLIKNGVDTSLLQKVNGQYSSTAFGITDRDDNQIWGFYTGADTKSDVISFPIKKNVDLAIVAPQKPQAMLKLARLYTRKKIPYLFDPGMQLRYLDGKDLSQAFNGAKIIIGNDYEIAVMEKKTGIKNLHDLSNDKKIVITTLGKNGSKLTENGKSTVITAAKVKNASDPSGAGDAYRGGFAAGFVRGFNNQICGQMGSVAAAYTVEKYGTTTHFYSLKEFEKRYKENYKVEIHLHRND